MSSIINMIPNGAYIYIEKNKKDFGLKEWLGILIKTECSILVVNGEKSHLFHVDEHRILRDVKINPLVFNVSNITGESLITHAHDKIYRLVNVVQRRYLGVIPQGVSVKVYFNSILRDAGIDYEIL